MAQRNVSNEFPDDDEIPAVFPEFNEGGELISRRGGGGGGDSMVRCPDVRLL